MWSAKLNEYWRYGKLLIHGKKKMVGYRMDGNINLQPGEKAEEEDDEDDDDTLTLWFWALRQSNGKASSHDRLSIW